MVYTMESWVFARYSSYFLLQQLTSSDPYCILHSMEQLGEDGSQGQQFSLTLTPSLSLTHTHSLSPLLDSSTDLLIN